MSILESSTPNADSSDWVLVSILESSTPIADSSDWVLVSILESSNPIADSSDWALVSILESSNPIADSSDWALVSILESSNPIADSSDATAEISVFSVASMFFSTASIFVFCAAASVFCAATINSTAERSSAARSASTVIVSSLDCTSAASTLRSGELVRCRAVVTRRRTSKAPAGWAGASIGMAALPSRGALCSTRAVAPFGPGWRNRPAGTAIPVVAAAHEGSGTHAYCRAERRSAPSAELTGHLHDALLSCRNATDERSAGRRGQRFGRRSIGGSGQRVDGQPETSYDRRRLALMTLTALRSPLRARSTSRCADDGYKIFPIAERNADCSLSTALE